MDNFLHVLPKVNTIWLYDFFSYCRNYRKAWTQILNLIVNIKVYKDEVLWAEVKELDLKIKKLVDLITDTDDPLIQAWYQSKLSELTLKKCTLLESANSHELYEKSSLKWLFEFTLPILKSPYKLWKSWDPKIMQLVPGVVIWGHFLYAENINFTTPQDVSIYADFNALKPQNL